MIFVNGREYAFEVSKSLTDLFSALDIYSGNGTAAAVNEVIIPTSQWGEYRIKDNDKILVIMAVQGG